MIRPDWQVATHVKAFSTTRFGGVSAAPFDALNLGLHVGDDEQAVQENRKRVQHGCALPSAPVWLNQTHGTTVYSVGSETMSAMPEHGVDGSWTDQPDAVLAVMTADCLPVLISDAAGTAVAAVHAGWRGLAAGILENTLAQFDTNASLHAWLGPAIGPSAFEVGEEVRVAFMQRQSSHASAFTPAGSEGKYWADLYALARAELRQTRSIQVTGGDYCTYQQSGLFYSHRRDGVRSGRMATLVWIDQSSVPKKGT